ncbi:uncharacterized protein (TIGR00369 family) [Rhodothalassium salexigens DSM 2132]|uniref:Uncharacterized protein (TIGR00369 family) n=1 Tax=Rhodothalassium salexigens DSM 2132 TaxID=1188247 RepID=A0A4R2PKH9_RHOSA|nr:PaaI family thioesterase [Rhodothalassium salexigens]MBB4211246.1 uncharacterized protein (TIGR00369 family) [Rhodothalassium salexigens DSM 2132]MBK1639340.1 hypothetical protein [Rhodothalassium salexigens DSM 2132]TCP35168.1 uncharacterized protein (TIGR00369 family) [Rhodothalassium salexigens DSM 2132]
MERHYTWQDPAPLADRVKDSDGLTYLQRMLDNGDRPPMASTLDFWLDAVGEGWTRWRGRPGQWAMNPIGSIHGGYAASLLDTALACAVHSTLDRGEAYTTLEFKVNLVRGLRPDAGEVVCESRIVHRGRRTGTAEAQLFDARGKLAAHGTTTCLIVPL